MGTQQLTEGLRKRHLIAVALDHLGKSRTKKAALAAMREANIERCEPRLLIRDLPAYYEDARKQHERAVNPNLANLETAAAEETEGAQAIEETDPEKVASVLTLARELYDLERDINVVNLKLEPLLKRHRELTTTNLPDAMKEAGVGDEFHLARDWKVVRKSTMTASLPTPGGIDKERDTNKQAEMKERLETGLAFLVKTGNQGIIKNLFQIHLAKGETNRAKGIIHFLRTRKIPFTHGKTVHPQTLSAFVREQIAEGREVPLDTFGAHEVTTVKLVPPKAKD